MSLETTSSHLVPGSELPHSIRGEFPIFGRATYLNSCSQGALSDRVRAAYEDYLGGLETYGSLWEHWVGQQEQVRGLLGRLLGTNSTHLAVTASASAGLNAVASAIDFPASRPRVVITDLDFPTTAQIWHAQARRGAEIHSVTTGSSAALLLEQLEEVVDERTAVVSVPHVCYRNGARVDLEPIVEIAHRHGARVVVDAYQSVGALPLDLDQLGADFVLGGMLKYLLGSPGAGFLFTDPVRTEGLIPTVTGWFAARDVFEMSIDGYDPAADARRFESGTPGVPSLYAAAAGLEVVLEVGVSATEAHVRRLCDRLVAGVSDLGGAVAVPDAVPGPLVAVRATDAEAYVAALEREQVIVSSRDGNVRISPHFYNSTEDIDRILDVMAQHRDLL